MKPSNLDKYKEGGQLARVAIAALGIFPAMNAVPDGALAAGGPEISGKISQNERKEQLDLYTFFRAVDQIFEGVYLTTQQPDNVKRYTIEHVRNFFRDKYPRIKASYLESMNLENLTKNEKLMIDVLNTIEGVRVALTLTNCEEDECDLGLWNKAGERLFDALGVFKSKAVVDPLVAKTLEALTRLDVSVSPEEKQAAPAPRSFGEHLPGK